MENTVNILRPILVLFRYLIHKNCVPLVRQLIGPQNCFTKFLEKQFQLAAVQADQQSSCLFYAVDIIIVLLNNSQQHLIVNDTQLLYIFVEACQKN